MFRYPAGVKAMDKGYFTLHFTGGNNHGCHGFLITIEALTDNTGVIKGGRCCTAACHGMPNYVLPMGFRKGERVRLPSYIDSWRAASKCARVPQLEISYNGETRVTPFDLVSNL